MKRLGPVQLAIVALVSRGVRSFDEIIGIMSRLSIPKSSVYTAVDELEKKGIIRVSIGPGGEKVLEIRGFKPSDIHEAKRRILERFRNIILLLSVASEETGEYDSLDPGVLMEYRRFLLSELEKVEKALGRWRRISIE